MTTKILGTGLNGLVGSRIIELLQDKYEFENISRSTGVDVTNQAQVYTAISSSYAPVVIHLTAKTDVDGCERDKETDILTAKEEGSGQELFKDTSTAWAINVVGAKNIVDACKRTNKKLIYFSTDFVFDGQKPTGDTYDESDTPNPLNWYGLTKYKGEDIVLNSGIPYAIIRLAYPYGHVFEKKKDFVQAILSRFQKGESVSGITDHLFVPTFIDDIAMALDVIISSNVEGVYHAVGSQALSPCEASLSIARIFGYSESLVQKTTREEYFKNRALRPYNLTLKNDRIKRLGVPMRTFEEGLKEINQ